MSLAVLELPTSSVFQIIRPVNNWHEIGTDYHMNYYNRPTNLKVRLVSVENFKLSQLTQRHSYQLNDCPLNDFLKILTFRYGHNVPSYDILTFSESAYGTDAITNFKLPKNNRPSVSRTSLNFNKIPAYKNA